MERSLFFLGFILVCLVFKCNGQEPPVVTCWIPWGLVDNTQFTATWQRNRACSSYNAILLEGYSGRSLQEFENIQGNQLLVPNLSRDRVYGLAVVCVLSNGDVGPYRRSRRCRTRTFGFIATTPEAPTPTLPVPVGSCGEGQFTCNDGECISADLWCNKIKECINGTDEENCAGSCVDLTFDDGNMTCSLFSSPDSACFFDCHEGLDLIGPRYRVCENEEWTRSMPSCLTAILQVFASRDFDDESQADLTIDVSNLVVDFRLTALFGRRRRDNRDRSLRVDNVVLDVDPIPPTDRNTVLVNVRMTGIPSARPNEDLYGVLVPIDNRGVRGVPFEFIFF